VKECLTAALCLGDSVDPMIAGVIHVDLLTILDRQSPGLRKYRVAKCVLRAHGTWISKPGRPRCDVVSCRSVADVGVRSFGAARACFGNE
jgi:hypothetical protein